ncbi:MAG: cyclodeaminase/cyclohydrolase family protein [Chloroflexi bacterium]|nr:cyclodeaminase/cyclohydrolase family protein [Chloroflexota bacterium]
MYTDNTINAFLDALASEEPVPGGGSTAALTGSLAAALVCMVCNLTLGKEDYASAQEQMETIRHQAEELRYELARLVDADMAVYSKVMAAYRLPRKDDELKKVRQEAIQAALQEAAEVPLQIAERCSYVLKLALPAAEAGNRWAISDAAAGALLAEASLRAALLNVNVNMASITDQNVVESLKARVAAITAESAVIKERTVGIVDAQFGG